MIFLSGIVTTAAVCALVLILHHKITGELRKLREEIRNIPNTLPPQPSAPIVKGTAPRRQPGRNGMKIIDRQVDNGMVVTTYEHRRKL